MELRNKKVGLALGGGAARGLAHIGVLEVLQKEEVPIDLIAGTSAGAIAGAIYARGTVISDIKAQVINLGWKKLVPLADLSLSRSGLIRGRKVKDLLALSIGDNTRFSDLRVPFACVATDIDNGEEIVIEQGSVLEAVRASISIPALFTVVKREGRYLVDGGLVNPVPVNILKQRGADFIIAVNVLPEVSAYLPKNERGKSSREPNIFHILVQSAHIGTYSLVRASLEEADIIIEPDVSHFGSGEFHRAQEIIQQGELAAQEAIQEIKSRLNAR